MPVMSIFFLFLPEYSAYAESMKEKRLFLCVACC